MSYVSIGSCVRYVRNWGIGGYVRSISYVRNLGNVMNCRIVGVQ